MTNDILIIDSLTCSACGAPCTIHSALDDADGFLCDDCADLS